MAEGIKLKLIRGKDQDVLKMWNKGDKKWVELRGKPDFERKYDPKDPLHKAISALGKSANISDFVNGDEVSINPNHPDGKKALKTIQKLMNESTLEENIPPEVVGLAVSAPVLAKGAKYAAKGAYKATKSLFKAKQTANKAGQKVAKRLIK